LSIFKAGFFLEIFDECENDSGEYENLDRPFNKIKQSLRFKFRKTVSEKYTSRTLQKLSNMNRVFMKESIGNLPSSDLAAILHALFFST
jgi:hypothetical protein